ncbi:uncharacterized protein ARMOST_10998 [Armillaria ostoyae]|uniref:Uncharacterized protein n=1 Tax=Armillaria ostoyae TaxID=47428 RepID=A0A284RFY3_ARMOS|nr:uncharacterized protein ARMOST_10998 [Armillaria ostoyae]
MARERQLHQPSFSVPAALYLTGLIHHMKTSAFSFCSNSCAALKRFKVAQKQARTRTSANEDAAFRRPQIIIIIAFLSFETLNYRPRRPLAFNSYAKSHRDGGIHEYHNGWDPNVRATEFSSPREGL